MKFDTPWRCCRTGSKAVARSFGKHPVLWTFFLTPVNLFAGVLAIGMAEFGQPLWLFAPVLIWLATVGLPTTLAVLLVAASWGWVPAMTGFRLFAICATILAFVFQSLCAGWCASRIRLGESARP